MPTIPYGRRKTDPESPTFEAVAMISMDGKGYTVPLAVASRLVALERELADTDAALLSAQRHAIACGNDAITHAAENLALRAELTLVCEEMRMRGFPSAVATLNERLAKIGHSQINGPGEDMNPTEFFRFVERKPAGLPEGAWYVMQHVLQQWWESEKMIPNAPGEWRDVPVLPEDDTPPSEWTEPHSTGDC